MQTIKTPATTKLGELVLQGQGRKDEAVNGELFLETYESLKESFTDKTLENPLKKGMTKINKELVEKPNDPHIPPPFSYINLLETQEIPKASVEDDNSLELSLGGSIGLNEKESKAIINTENHPDLKIVEFKEPISDLGLKLNISADQDKKIIHEALKNDSLGDKDETLKLSDDLKSETPLIEKLEGKNQVTESDSSKTAIGIYQETPKADKAFESVDIRSLKDYIQDMPKIRLSNKGLDSNKDANTVKAINQHASANKSIGDNSKAEEVILTTLNTVGIQEENTLNTVGIQEEKENEVNSLIGKKEGFHLGTLELFEKGKNLSTNSMKYQDIVKGFNKILTPEDEVVEFKNLESGRNSVDKIKLDQLKPLAVRDLDGGDLEIVENKSQPVFKQIETVENISSESLIDSSSANENIEKLELAMVDFVRTSKEDNSTTMIVRLNPESLGELNLDLKIEDGKLTAKIFVENAQVREMLDGKISELTGSLTRQNISIEKIHIEATQGSGNNQLDMGQGRGFNQQKEQKTWRQNLNHMFRDNKGASEVIHVNNLNSNDGVSILA